MYVILGDFEMFSNFNNKSNDPAARQTGVITYKNYHRQVINMIYFAFARSFIISWY